MKKNYLFWVAFCVTVFLNAQTIFINEIHYANSGGDTDEGVEICGPAGTELAGYEVRLYNGSGGGIYETILHLSGIIPNQQNNIGTLWFAKTGIQNGLLDGLALVDNTNAVIQFLSYGGVITATDGPAVGMTSVDIGVSESETTPIGYSLQLIGSGSNYADFSWVGPVTASPGMLNANQTLSIVKNQIEGFSLYPNPISNGKLFMSSSSNLDKKLEIYSMMGNCIYSEYVNANETIDVSKLNSGIYMVRVEEEDKIAARKLIIK
ncbi:T9SS type A sorting domain-containing protein [uncultured Lutibacter sp.]|uniref:T9SS type A sorting domain-containing protein n=1 Tax=uncultured Lutibacter sp. TaxID=437739 RepID=UPI0026165A85|nr:T9SS type A sorting domain-containing protein [uncultured Lutibacter sp.]